MMRNKEQTLGNLIDRKKIAYLSYLDGEGYPVTKAMLMTKGREGIKTIYFSTNTSSNKVACFRKDPRASVYFDDRRFYRGVSLLGTVEVLEDQETKDRFWEEGDERYYPLGRTDPDYCILKFTASKGRYFSNGSEDFTV